MSARNYTATMYRNGVFISLIDCEQVSGGMGLNDISYFSIVTPVRPFKRLD